MIFIAPISAGKNQGAFVAGSQSESSESSSRVIALNLLGVHVFDDLKWSQNVQAICAKLYFVKHR